LVFVPVKNVKLNKLSFDFSNRIDFWLFGGQDDEFNLDPFSLILCVGDSVRPSAVSRVGLEGDLFEVLIHDEITMGSDALRIESGDIKEVWELAICRHSPLSETGDGIDIHNHSDSRAHVVIDRREEHSLYRCSRHWDTVA
jgi:hypothetical protein